MILWYQSMRIIETITLVPSKYYLLHQDPIAMVSEKLAKEKFSAIYS